MQMSSTPPFCLGETMEGVDENDSTKLVNEDHVGKVYIFQDRKDATSGRQARNTGYQVWAICLRNVSGGILLPKRLAVLDQTNADMLLKQVTGYAGNDERLVVAVDEYLHATNGVADDELFWGIIRGKTTLTSPGTAPTLAVGDEVSSAASGFAENGSEAVATTFEAVTAADTEFEVTMHVPWY